MARDHVDRRAGRAARGLGVVVEDRADRRARLRRLAGERRGGQPEAVGDLARPAPVRASSRPVVEAAVASLASSPVSHRAIRSGTSAMRSAAASASEPSSASSWKTVLIGIVWMPVTRRGRPRTRSWARATIPSVRSSR